MHPFALCSQTLGHSTGKSDHIVAGLLLDFVNTIHVKRCILTKQHNILFRNNAKLSPSFTCANFHFQPRFKFVLLGPDRSHFRSAVTIDHMS
ncbi:hypothetical protein D3C77_677030 [compost metagenome]